MGQADVAARQGDTGTESDVEADVELGDGYGGLLAGDADAGKGELTTADSAA